MSSSAENNKSNNDNDYHLEEGAEVEGQDKKLDSAETRRKLTLVGVVALAVLALVLLVFGIQKLRGPKVVYTTNDSRYGVPDECDGTDAYCAEERGKTVTCTCGAYLDVYEYDKSNNEWVLVSNNNNGGGNNNEEYNEDEEQEENNNEGQED